jgi:hypothetical protein
MHASTNDAQHRIGGAVRYFARQAVPNEPRRAAFSEDVVSFISWLLTAAVLIALIYMGILRPTGLAGRAPAEREKERQRDVAAKWLDKNGE